MKKKKPKNPQRIESDGLREALEKLIQRREKERAELRPKQRRLFQILAQQRKKERN
jgi:hypothetical protein